MPWRRNGGGANLNCFQISLMIKLQDAKYHKNHTLPLVSLSGFDSWSSTTKAGAGEAPMPIVLGLVDGRMAVSNGMARVVANGKHCTVHAGRWSVVSWPVDANAGTVRCFLNGSAASDAISVDWLKRDGPGTLSGRVAINKFDPNYHPAGGGVTLLRSVSIYNKCLDPEQVAAEADELRAKHADDALRRLLHAWRDARAAPHIVAFEPGASAFAALREKGKAWPTTVTLVNAAVSDAPGEVHFSGSGASENGHIDLSASPAGGRS